MNGIEDKDAIEVKFMKLVCDKKINENDCIRIVPRYLKTEDEAQINRLIDDIRYMRSEVESAEVRFKRMKPAGNSDS